MIYPRTIYRYYLKNILYAEKKINSSRYYGFNLPRKNDLMIVLRD